MNELINQLAEHCDFYVGNEHYDKAPEEKQKLWTEKFAELIVRECIAKIEEAAEYSPELYGVALDLIDYFGIEE